MYYLSLMAHLVFTNKVTSTSVDGIEAVSLQLQGDGKVARKITVGIATPSVGGAAGDVVLSASPLDSGYAGWIFTTENKWRRFGLISNKNDETLVSADKIGIGTTNAQTSKLRVTGGSISFEGSDDAFTSGGPRGFIDVDGVSQTVRFGATGGGTTDTKGISFYTVNDGTGSSEVARIKSNGNVGIA